MWSYGFSRMMLIPLRAVWTRFHPLGFEVEKVLQSGVLGKPKRFSADFSMDWNPDGESLNLVTIDLDQHT